MAAQLDYTYNIQKGVPGGIYDISDHTIVSRTVEPADGVILNGMAVAVGATPGVTVVPGDGTKAFEGVVVRNGVNAENDKFGKAINVQTARISVMTKGKIWVRLAEGVEPTYGDDAYVHTDGTFTKTKGTTAVGKFISSADNGLAVVEL